jgi:hypothetical protein
LRDGVDYGLAGDGLPIVMVVLSVMVWGGPAPAGTVMVRLKSHWARNAVPVPRLHPELSGIAKV